MIARKLIVLLLAAALAAFVVGCGGKAAVDDQPTTIETPPAVETPPPVEEPPVTRERPVEVAAPEVDDVFFAFDKYNLTAAAKQTLEQNARGLRNAASSRLLIEGHCDERGTKSYNLALGEKRANAARDYLVSLGVPASRINVISYGKERPFDMGHSESAWSKNRRAHMVVRK